jgi:hypothetical protein
MHNSLEAEPGEAMGKTLHCMLCGKEKFDPEASYEQQFYLCGSCTRFWFTDYVRRLKSRLVAMLPWNWR